MTDKPYYSDDTVTLWHGDCLDVLRSLPDASVDAVVTDPPYGLEFMGKDWDSFNETPATRRSGWDHASSGAGFSDSHKGTLPTFGGRWTSECAGCGRRDAFAGPKCRCDGAPQWQRVRTDGGASMVAFGRWCELWTAECLRVLKPGGHLLAFGGTRTWHRLACAVEDAGFEVRDSIAWLYGSGFPKSLDVSKAIDKRRDWSLVERLSGEIRRARAEAGLSLAEIGQATLDATDGTYGKWYHRGGHMFFETGRSLPSRPEWEHLRHVLPIAPEFVEVYDEAEREVIGSRTVNGAEGSAGGYADGIASQRGLSGVVREIDITAPATPDAERWQGWGTALKPAFEPIVVARKPLAGTVAANVLEHGTGALNIDGCRIGTGGEKIHVVQSDPRKRQSSSVRVSPQDDVAAFRAAQAASIERTNTLGRWPTNVVLDNSQAALLDQMSGESSSRAATSSKPMQRQDNEVYGKGLGTIDPSNTHTDQGGASRFFPTFRYEAKAPASERPFYYRPTCECEDAWPTHTPSTARATDGTTAPASSSTSKSGSATTGDLSPTATRSTTSTATSSTTTPTTSSPSPRPTTSASTPAANSETATGGSRAAFAASSSPSEPVTGTSAMRGGRSTDDAARATSQGWSATSVCGECGAPTRREAHATVKPLDLMRWLVRLVTPPGGTVLEPFAGSGTTVEACVVEGFKCIAIEKTDEYLPLTVARIHRRRDPVAAIKLAGDDLGLFDLGDTP